MNNYRLEYFNEQLIEERGCSLLELPGRLFRTKNGDPSRLQAKWKEGSLPTVRKILRLGEAVGINRFRYAHPAFLQLDGPKISSTELRLLESVRIYAFLESRYGSDGAGYVPGSLPLLDNLSQELAAIQISINSKDVDRFELAWKQLPITLANLLGSSMVLLRHRDAIFDSVKSQFCYPSARIGLNVSGWHFETLVIEAVCKNFGYYRDVEFFKKCPLFKEPTLSLGRTV